MVPVRHPPIPQRFVGIFDTSEQVSETAQTVKIGTYVVAGAAALFALAAFIYVVKR